MEHSRRRQAEGKKPLKDDYEALVYDPAYLANSESSCVIRSGETLRLHGGLSENGRPAELVREKDGNLISLESGKVLYKDVNNDVDDEEDVERSMARKRKCDIGKEVWRACRECGKEFKRSCDLTKHEKTHSRPWKCPEESCKYHTLGWPTEKECDRHVNDKHSSAPALYKCLWKDCAYTSKRESNCKQHMEKTHGYEYVRSKSKKASRLVPTIQTPSSMPSPASIVPSLSTPGSHALTSPYESSSNNFTAPTSARTAESDFGMSTAGSESLLDSPYDFGSGSEHGFIFHAFNGDLQQEDAGLSANFEVGRGSLDSSMMDQSPESELASLLNGPEFDAPFDFGRDNRDNPWPSPESFFDNYNITAQQPTPALSEYDFGKNASAGASGDIDMQEFISNDIAPMPSHAQPDMTLYSPPADILAQTSPAMPQIGGDFEIFAEGHIQDEGAEMFPALENVGQQFPSTADASFGSLERPLQDYTFE